MITENIKTLLGEELAGQVETALTGKGKDGKDVDLVCGNDGSYVPEEKYEGEKRKATAAETALKGAAAAVKALGGSGEADKLADDVAAAKDTIDTLKTDHKAEIAKIHKDTALRMALAGDAHDPDDVMRLLDKEKIEVGEDGVLKTDLAGLVNPIRESKPYLFKAKEPGQPPLKGAQPAPPAGGAPAAKPIDQMTYSEMTAYMAANPGATI